MERATLAKRCIFIEADKRVKETDIKQIFSNVVQLTALKKETTDDDDQIKWILLFTTVDGKWLKKRHQRFIYTNWYNKLKNRNIWFLFLIR